MVFRNDRYFVTIDSYLSSTFHKDMIDKLFFLKKLKRVIFTKMQVSLFFIIILLAGDMSSINQILFAQHCLIKEYWFKILLLDRM